MLSRNLLIATTSRALAGGSSIGVAMVLANAFEPKVFASFRFFQITLVMLVAVAGPGISLSASKLFAQFSSNQHNEGSPIGLFCLSSTLIAAVVAISLPLLPDSLISKDIPVSLWALSIGVFFSAAMTVPMGGMIGLEQFGRLLKIDIVTTSILIVGVFLAIRSDDIQLAIWALIFSQAVGFVLAYSSILREISPRVFLTNLRDRSTIGDVRDTINVTGANAIIVVALSLQFWGVGRIILSANNDPLVFAAYSIGVQWFSLASMLPDVVGRTTFPAILRLANSTNQDMRSEKKRLIRHGLVIILVSTTLVAAATYVLAPYLIKLYGSAYQEQSHLLWQFAAAAIPYCLAIALGYSFLAHNQERVWVTMVVVELGIVIATCWGFVGTGASSGAIAFGLGGLVIFFIAGAYAAKQKLF